MFLLCVSCKYTGSLLQQGSCCISAHVIVASMRVSLFKPSACGMPVSVVDVVSVHCISVDVGSVNCNSTMRVMYFAKCFHLCPSAAQDLSG